ALAAFLAFTLPSALILMAFAMTAAAIEGPFGAGALAGLRIVAVAIVAHAVWGMARALCPDGPRAGIAVGAVAWLAFVPGAAGMVGAIALGAIAGLSLKRGEARAVETFMPIPISRMQAIAALCAFAGLLVVLPLAAGMGQVPALFDAFYRAGALVFGGGHVVLPLLQTEVVAPGWVSPEVFLAGYGAAQAVPGPLFTFAAYLGTVLDTGPGGIAGALLALGAVFLPGFLILIGVLPCWDRFRQIGPSQSAMQGANAAVVGILAAALYTPVFTGAVGDMRDLALALAGLGGLTVWRRPPWGVVGLGAAGGAGLALL
ncbi:MAG: chromate efflux transporter, partial [Rhodobacteraceae bacterium]|nr:chromate efflux transporter [Paracoccaceae bacterium]